MGADIPKDNKKVYEKEYKEAMAHSVTRFSLACSITKFALGIFYQRHECIRIT
jgi:hypothetical protein